MNKLFKNAASFLVGAAVFVTQTQATPVIGTGNLLTAYAAGPSSSSTTGKPEVLGYTVTDTHNREISSIKEDRKFNLIIEVMDRVLKSNGISNANDIIFTKSLGRFKYTSSAVAITSTGTEPLKYTITLEDCVWQGGSNTFGFLVGYASGADFFDLSLDVSECVTTADKPDPPSDSSAEPIFKITANDAPEIKAGDSGSFEISLKNLGSVDADRVLVEITTSDDIILTDGSYTQDIDSIGAYDTETIEISYKALGKINSAKQPFNISLHYYYDGGNGETTGNASTTINIPAVISGSSTTEPIFKITPSISSEIKSGESGYFTVNIKNLSSVDVKRMLLETTASEDVVINENSLSQEILIIPANSTASVTVHYTALDKINSAKQNFSISMRYFYDGGNGETSAETTASVTVPSIVNDTSDENSDPLLKLIGQSPTEPISEKSEYEYILTVKNFGDTAVNNANLFFEASDSLYFIDGTDIASIEEIPANGSAEVKVKFRTSDSISSIKQSITAHITYSYVSGGIKKNAETDTSVIIIAKQSEAPSGGNAAVPNIIIKSYDIGAEQIAAGDPFNLKLELLNTSNVTGVENIIMTVNAGGSINIFGGSNTFYYSKLSASGEIAETIPLKALPTAETGISSISISLKYDYFDKETRNTSNTEQTIFIPVYQPDKMTFDIAVPTYPVQVGSDTYITTTYLNKGRSDISNVKAEIVGDVGALSTSKVIGTVQPGGNGSFDFIISPYMSGLCEFTIKVTYEDATLTEVTKEFPVSFTVDEPFDPGFIDPGMVDPGFEDPTIDEGGGFPWWLLWIGIGVLVVGGIVTIIIVVKHKKKKKKALTEADIDWEDEFADIPSGNSSNNNDNNTTKV